MHLSIHKTVNRRSAIIATGVLLAVASIFFSGCSGNEVPAAKSKPTNQPKTHSSTRSSKDATPSAETAPQADNSGGAAGSASNEETSDAVTIGQPSSNHAKPLAGQTPPLVSGVAGEGDLAESDAERHSRKKLPAGYFDQRLARGGSSQSPMEAFRTPPVSATPLVVDIPAKVRRYAEKLVTRYDLDSNGTLEPVEWLQMRGDPRDDDLNGDEILTAEELAIRIAVYGHRRLIRLMPGRRVNEPVARVDSGIETGSQVHATTTPGDAAAAVHREKRMRSRQFYVRSSRLPVGLPEWFVEGDTNGDAQMSLAEFSAKWSSSELHRFDTYDHDGDGMITARECARGELARQQIESAESVERSTSSEPLR